MSIEEPLEPVQLPLLVKEAVKREAERIGEEVKKAVEIASQIRKFLKERGLIYRTFEPKEALKSVAIDSDFTYPPLELVSGRLFIVIRAYVFGGGAYHKEKPRFLNEAFVKFLKDHWNERSSLILAKIFEKSLALQLLRDKENGLADFEVVLFDGEIIPRVISIRSQIEKELFEKLIDITSKILEYSERTGTPLIGVIKRVQGRSLEALTSIKQPFNDKAMGTLILEPGEYVIIGSIRDIIGKLGDRRPWLKKMVKKIPKASEILEILYKTFNPVLFELATKIEAYIPEKLRNEEYITYLISKIASITGQTGAPDPTDRADRLCSLRGDVIGAVHQGMIAEVSRVIGDFSLVFKALGLTNPEKIYPYEYPVWRRRPRTQRL
ncbi:MAG TPA: DNA double-strand break repair nuclease NurA [Thermoproteales archaeon]|nr:DNA double-strand break repair nuclease NurA [Thermoproteales archaeon]